MTDILSFSWNADPVIFKIGSLSLRYYSVLFVSGFIIGLRMFMYFFKREGIPASLLDTLLYLLIGCTLVGARVGHCLFYEFDYYSKHFFEIFIPFAKMDNGEWVFTGYTGLASHGGTIAILIGIAWFVWKYGKKYNFGYVWLLDRLAIATAFAACFIRLGNFMNSEIYGHVTNLPWGVIFLRRGEVLPKHPTQLYEALCYLVTGFILLFIYRKYLSKIKNGLLLGIFFIGIFFSRFVIEFVKENQETFEDDMILNMGQLLSIPFIICGIILIWRSFLPGTPAAEIKRVSAKK